MSVHSQFRFGKKKWDNAPVMGYRLAWTLLACAAAAAAFAGQQAFPHPIGPPGVRIERLGDAHLPRSTKDAIVALVFRNSDSSDCIFPDGPPRKEIDGIRIAETKLSEEGTDLLVQASDSCNCGATGNCSFWVLHQKPDGFETLLATNMVQQFSVEETRSGGYNDLMTASHGSAFLQGLVLYQFDGKQYRATQCATAEYHLQDDHTVSDEPTITPPKACDTE